MSSFDVESLFQSIDIILTQRLNALSYDTTVIATIVDDSDKDKGHYIVSDDTIKFDAYTTDTTYKTGEQVRVTVINGDWSQKKFIEGKYSDKEADEKAVTYIPPLGTTLQSNLSQIGQKSKWTLYTNSETYAKDPFVITIPEDSDLFNLQNKGIYDVLTIAADISTNLGNLSAGNYGLRLDLLITPESGSEYRIQKFITFDSSEMLGNPYNFIIDSHQEKRIAIADLGHVTEIVLTPYQGVVIADDGTETPAPFLDREGKSIGYLPIYFKNVVLGFGSDLAMLEDNSLKLYTPDLPFYDYNGSFGSSANHKRLGLIWCNKTETNEYIGFSDGIVDIDDDGNIVPYDEIEYLKASNFDERLVAQTNKVGIPSDKTSLTLAANIADAVPLMKSSYENLTTGLSQVLQRFNGQIVGATSIQEVLKPLIFQYKDGETQYPPKLVQFKDAAKEKATLLEELYTNILQYGYNTEKGLTPNDWNENWGNTDYYILFKNIISEALGAVAAFLKFAEQETATGKVLSGYRRIYNDYEPKINAQIKLINTYINQIPIDINAVTGDLAILKSYQTKTDYTPYVKENFSEYANRYCIYWYHYNEGYKLEYIPPVSESEWNNNKTEHSDYQAYLDYCENNNIEYKYRNFLGDNWERLTIAYDLNEVDAVVNPRPLINFGLPNTVGETVDAVTYFPPAPAESQILTRWLDPCTVDEKYQAVLFYNHEMVKSNIVVFTNSEEVPPRFKVNAGDVLRIEHDTDSREHYQVYSSANDLLNISDGSKTRQLKCFYDGVLTGDETLADAEIYWYIPVNSTMLTYDKKFLVEKQGFSTDIDEKTPYSKDGYVYFNKKIGYTRTEEIMTDEDGKEMYDSNGNALRETIITIKSEDRFFFYKIKSFYESSAQNNTILVYAYVPNKEEPTVGEINFTFGTFGSNGTKYTLAITPATNQIAVLPAADTGDNSGNLQLNLTLYNANSEKLDMTTGVSDSAGYYNLTAEWYAHGEKAPVPTDWIGNIENSKSKSLEIPGVLGTNYTDKYAGIIKASVSYQSTGANIEDEETREARPTERVITLSALYAVPYASSEDLYISGPTSIIYNSQGTISRLSEEPYCLYQHTKNGDIKATIKKESENEPVIIEPEWSIKYYNSSGEEVSDPKIINYLPKLTPDNTLQPSPLYCDYGNEVYVPVVICTLDGNIVWTQPIIVIQNAYESSMLNNWNGGLVIDEANATIMTTMIGAGKKDANNQFYGVLMGDLVAGADFDSKNVNTGIHGFHAGVQSFNFSVDGTAFLGKAGRGRIYFNGDKGTIKSGSYDVDEASGMLIDLDDALIHMRGANSEIRLNALASGYTPYFQITSPKTNNSLIYISDNNYYLQSSNFNGESGMNIDLDTGCITSYNFALDAWNDNSGIQMNSDGTPYYFKAGTDESNCISLSKNKLDIQATNFKLNARSDIPSGIYLSSLGDEYFWVGSSSSNYITLKHSTGVDIQTTQLLLNAWTPAQQQQKEETGEEPATPTTFAMPRAATYNIGGTWILDDTINYSTNVSISTNFIANGQLYSRMRWDVTSGLFFDGVQIYDRNGEWIIFTAKTILIPKDTYVDITGYDFLSSIASYAGGGSTEQTYTLTFNLNGGTWDDGSTTGSISGVSGETINGIHTPIKSGDTFTGWALTGGGSYSAEDNEYIFGNADGILTATWASGEEDNSGSSGEDDETVLEGEGMTTPVITEDSAGEGIYINSKGSPFYFLVGSKGNNNDNYIALGDKTNGLDIKTKQFELNAWISDAASVAEIEDVATPMMMAFSTRALPDDGSVKSYTITVNGGQGPHNENWTLSDLAYEMPNLTFTINAKNSNNVTSFVLDAGPTFGQIEGFISDSDAQRLIGFTWGGNTYSLGKTYNISVPALITNVNFEPIYEYSLQIKLNGGNLNSVVNPLWGQVGETINVSSVDPIKNDYIFAGWSFKGAGSFNFSLPYTYTVGKGGATITANWTQADITYLVSIDGSGGCSTTVAADTLDLYIKIGQSAIGSETAVTIWFDGEDEDKYTTTYRSREDLLFAGLSVGTDETSYDYAANGTTYIKTLTSKQFINLQSVFKYPLYVNPNGGYWRNSTSTTTVWGLMEEEFDNIGDPTRDGYVFKEWQFSGGGSWIHYDGEGYGLYTCGSSPSYLTAVWEGDEEPIPPPGGGSGDTDEEPIPPTGGGSGDTGGGGITLPVGPLASGKGIYINSSPDEQGYPYYFKVGSATDNYISLAPKSNNATGGLDIKTNQLILQVDKPDEDTYLYLGNTPSENAITYIDEFGAEQSTDKNLLLQLGKKFGVSGNGILYATEAFISGNIVAETGKIGGWQIGENSLYYMANETTTEDNTPIQLNGANGFIQIGNINNTDKTVAYFLADSDGTLMARNAFLDRLTVTSSLIVNKEASQTYMIGNENLSPEEIYDNFDGDGGSGAVIVNNALASLNGDTKIDGNTEITGTSRLLGEVNIGSTNSAANLNIRGSTAIRGDLKVYCGNTIDQNPVLKVVQTGTGLDGGSGSGLWLTADYVVLDAGTRSYIGVDKNHICHMNGTLLAQGDFYYSGAIYCCNASATEEEKLKNQGTSGDLEYLVAGWKTKKARFVNGILVDADISNSDDEAAGESALPSIEGNANKFLQVDKDANTTQWTTIYAPLSKGLSGQVWASNGSYDDNSKPSWQKLDNLLGTGSSDGQFLSVKINGATTQGTSYSLSWKTLYAPSSKGISGQVWASNGSNSEPSWQTLDSLLGTVGAGGAGASGDQFLSVKVNGTTQGTSYDLSWKTLGKMAFVDYVKKKFEITLSGSTNNHNYYVELDEEEYTPIGEEFSFYKEASQFTYTPIGTAYTPEYVENYTGQVIKTSQTLYSAGTPQKARKESYNKVTGYYAGTPQKYKTYTSAGAISLTMKGEQDITIEPSETETDSIPVSISQCTVTID